MNKKILNAKKLLSKNFEIKRAGQADLERVWKVIKKCSEWLSEKGLDHWKNYYTRELTSKMIDKKEVWLGLENGNVIGTITVSNEPPKYYYEMGYSSKFAGLGQSAVYIGALGVLPEEQGRGVAGKMLEVVEKIVINQGVKWLRLDCRDEVPGLVEFYEKRNFLKVEDNPMDEGEDGKYWVMEKRVGDK